MPKDTGKRPRRLTVRDELGRRRTLPSGARYLEVVRSGAASGAVLLLGAAADPEGFAEALAARSPASMHTLAHPALEAQCSATFPKGWRSITPAEADTLLTDPAVTVLAHGPTLRAFPSYYFPLTARVLLAAKRGERPTSPRRAVLLPDGGGTLRRECAEAFAALGFEVLRMDPEALPQTLPELLTRPPALCFSVNFEGLDPLGERFYALREAGCRVAIWCVDNPFQLLTAVKGHWWQEADLCVTDASFLPALAELGAQSLQHLPLATSPNLFANVADPAPAPFASDVLFVGRLSFPAKARYYSGLSLDEADLAAAKALMDRGGRPDFAWWVERLGTAPIWPGNDVRLPGLGAEACARTLRGSYVRAAAEAGPLTVYGDADWRAILAGTGATIHPPVDYYGPLAALYTAAPLTLNVTSLLLPQGLTQRHFDVWSAGGFLLTDATPGLSIFPEELTAPVSLASPGDVPERLAYFKEHPHEAAALRLAWREEILARHGYATRLGSLLEALELAAK